MALIRALRARRRGGTGQAGDQSGIALLMVIAAISVLSILVTEFTYVAQINQKIAFDGLDQLKAHYLAKTGLKISLLRLKAYQNVSTFANGMAKAAGGDAAKSMVPKALIDKIWSFPFFYPFPTNIPGMTQGDKDRINAFQKASGLDGKFSSVIESESSKYNLNMLLAGYVPKPNASPSPAPASPAAGPSPGPNNPAPSATQAPEFKKEVAMESLKNFLGGLLSAKMEKDPAWADAYRDPHLLDDLVDNIMAWADPKYERRNQSADVQMKRAPFSSVTELHMIPGMDDDLYDLFAPNLTVTRTPGINVNTVTESTLKALFPLATADELTDFFKNRDSTEQDGTFKSEDDFFKYVKEHFAAYSRGSALDQLKDSFAKGHVQFVTDETEFKITVQAQVNQSTRLIEAWVTLGSQAAAKPQGSPANPNPAPNGAPPATTPAGNTANAAPDPGLKIHFMRVL